MKTRILLLVQLMGLIAFVAFALMGHPEATGGIVLAMAAGAGTVVTGETVTTENVADASSELLTNSIRENITKMMPSRYPLDTIIRNVGLVIPIKSWKSEYYSVDYRGYSDTIKSAFDTSASGTYDSSSGIHTIALTAIHMWNVDDNLMVRGINGSDSRELVLHIVSKTAASYTVGVIPLNGLGVSGTDLPDIPINTIVTRIGNSKSELDAQTSPFAVFPQKAYNYAQIHMAQVEDSFYNAIHAKEVKWDIQDYRAQSIYDMRAMAEFTSIFGVRALKTDPIDGDEKYFSGGITRFVSGNLEYTENNIVENDFIGWCEEIFTGNSGSDTRILFPGKELMTDMANVSLVQRQLEAKSSEVQFGIKFAKIETNFGILLVKHHDLFNYAGWSKKGLVLDPNNIERHVFKDLEARKLDLKTSGIRNADAYVMDETFCLATRYPDTHFVVEPSASS